MRPPTHNEVRAAMPAASAAVVGRLSDEARRRGSSIHLVGGPVRDLLLGRPLRDVDLVVETEGRFDLSEMAREALEEGFEVVSHDRFATVTIVGAGVEIDLATARRETYAHAGALPEVECGSLEEDLRRRDFSVNAMAVELTAAGEASAARVRVIDPEGGVADLEAGQLRILHRRSFHDDPTRALRAARLAPRLGFSLSRRSRSCLRDALRDGAFGRVSGDRLRREFEKLFSDAVHGLVPTDALRRMADWHVLGALEPGLDLPAEARVPLRRHGRAIAKPPWSSGRWRPWAAGLFVWMAPLPPGLRRRALRRFSVHGDLAQRAAAFARQRERRLAQLGKARGRGAVDALLSGLREEEVYGLYAWATPAVRRRIERFGAEDRARRIPINGRELENLGLSGATIGRVLGRVRAAVLDGQVANREEALALAREHARRRRSR